jgi:hypothetical protein
MIQQGIWFRLAGKNFRSLATSGIYRLRGKNAGYLVIAAFQFFSKVSEDSSNRLSRCGDFQNNAYSNHFG